MAEIVWTDVRPANPQAVRAENGTGGTRTVEVRLTVNLEAAKPYKIQFTLRDHGRLMDEWINGYSSRNPSDAHRAYDRARALAATWLAGFDLQNCRPSWWRRQGGR